MKNYTYGWLVKDKGYVEVPVEEYTLEQKDMKEFIDSMSPIVFNARCGWHGVRYEVMEHERGDVVEYMVLYCNGGGDRWIPVRGNSRGANLSVLGENLW